MLTMVVAHLVMSCNAHHLSLRILVAHYGSRRLILGGSTRAAFLAHHGGCPVPDLIARFGPQPDCTHGTAMVGV